jgi:hypothetical protein
MPDETSEYGIHFARQPLNEEKESIREELKKTKKHKAYNADSPGLTAALNSTVTPG